MAIIANNHFSSMRGGLVVPGRIAITFMGRALAMSTTRPGDTSYSGRLVIGGVYVIKLQEYAQFESAIECPEELTKPIQKWQRSGKQRMPKPR